MATASTFLQLAPEFGGTKFGPFPGVEVRLGSDPTRNDIVLPEALGVLPAHVRVVKQQDNSFILAPTERTAAVYLHRNDGRPPRHLTTPTAVQTGDAFSLVTAEGPRFIILVEQPTRAATKDAVAPPKDDKKSLGGGVMAEMKRMGLAKFFSSKIGNFFQTAWMMIKTGTIFSPRYIVMGMMMIVPLFMAGGMSCAAFSFQRSSAKKAEQIEDLKADLDACGAGDSGEDPTVMSLAQAILKDRKWQHTFEADPTFNAKFQSRLKALYARSDQFRWVYQRKKSDFTDVMGRLERELGPDLTRVFAYTAAHPGLVPDRQWGLLARNSEGARACGRGPMLMTFRQATNLGMSVQPDALADAGLAASDDLELKAAALRATLGGSSREFKNEEIESEGAGMQGGFQCLYLAGDDERTDARAIATALGKALGTRAKDVPEEGTDFWILARLLKFYAADFLIGYEDLKFSRNTAPSMVIDESGPTQKDFAIEMAAEVAARATVIPCLAATSKGTKADHLGPLPTFVQCGVLRLLVEDSE